MVSQLVPARIDFKSAGPDFWKRYHAYRLLRHKESRPDDPLRPDDLEEKRLKRDNPFDLQFFYEIAKGGLMLSWFSSSTSKPGTAGHESNKHLFWADIYVHPDHRRQGIGASWLPLILELMDTHGCTVVGIGTEDPPGHSFLKWIGAAPKLSGAENRLKLADVDWKMVERWIEEGPKRSPLTKLEIYEGPLPEAMLGDFAPQLTSMLNTIPFENLDHGEIVVTPDHMREWYAELAIGDERLLTILTREPDGVISAITDTGWAPTGLRSSSSASPGYGRTRAGAASGSGSRRRCSRASGSSIPRRTGSRLKTRARMRRCWRSTRSSASSSTEPRRNTRSAETGLRSA